MQNEAVNQWLDADQVRSLAEGLLEQSPQGRPIPNEKMFGSSFVGFAGPSKATTSVSTVAQKSLSEAQSRAASSGIIKGGSQAVPTSAPVVEEIKVEQKLAPESEEIKTSSETVTEKSSPFKTKLAASSKVVEPTKTTEIAKAVAPAKAVTAAKMMGAAEKVTESAKPEDLTKPLDSKKANEPTKVAESKKSAEPVKTSEPVKSDAVSKSPEPKKSPTQASTVSFKEKAKQESVAKKTVLDKSGGSTKVPAQPTFGSRPAPAKKPDLIASPFKIATKPKRVTKPAPPARDAFRPVPLSTRLQAFGEWLKEQIPTRAYFICDRHGEIVVDEVGSEKLVKVARTLAHASSSAGRQVGDDKNLGSLHVKVGPDRVMEVIPRHSHFGLVVLGIIVPRPLSRDAVASVSRALGTALAEPSTLRQ